MALSRCRHRRRRSFDTGLDATGSAAPVSSAVAPVCISYVFPPCPTLAAAGGLMYRQFHCCSIVSSYGTRASRRDESSEKVLGAHSRSGAISLSQQEGRLYLGLKPISHPYKRYILTQWSFPREVQASKHNGTWEKLLSISHSHQQ